MIPFPLAGQTLAARDAVAPPSDVPPGAVCLPSPEAGASVSSAEVVSRLEGGRGADGAHGVGRTRTVAILATLLTSLACATLVHERRIEPTLRFDRDVRAILADRCFSCHGPDEEKRKAGLRLDLEDGAREVLEGGANSEFARRVASHDENEVMPPPKLKRPLSDAQRATLLRWASEGAAYMPHWAFVAPRKVAAPRTRNAIWARDELDLHVLAALERAGLAPRPQADPRLLLRRASLVLTGLPPTPDEAEAFARDPSASEFARRVDAMLASPRAAEHMATTWLDLARYADTHGYQTDGGSFTWPWRDWLLSALQSNMPYDQFVRAILAGDLQPEADLGQRVATGFQRLHRMTEEGGSIAEEFRQEGIADRVGTFGTTFLGLTLECARCHDHKFDPLPTREFYALAAMFGSIDENGLKSYALPVNAPPPFVRLASEEQRLREQELRAALEQAQAQLALRRAEARTRLQSVRLAPTAMQAPPPDAHWAFESLENGLVANLVAGALPASVDRRRPEQLGQFALGGGKFGAGASFDGDGGLLLDGLAGFGRHDEISIALWIRPSERNARAAIVHASGFYTQDADASGIELELVDGHVRWSAIHFWPGSAASVRVREPLPLDVWTHLVVSYDGSARASGLRVHVNGVPENVEVVRDGLDGPLAGHTLELGSRSRGSGFRGGAIDELRVWRRALTSVQARELASSDGLDVAPDEFEAFEQHFAEALDENVAAARAAVRTAQRELAAHLDGIPAFACMQDSAFAPPTYVLRRGAYDQPDVSTVVAPGALEAVLPFDASLPRNREGLVRWMLDPRNPLVARVAVNRLWAQVFGRGLVETSENFGLQGSFPSNPELLDALAVDFARGDGTLGSAWNLRALLRRLVLCSTFRQDSRACDEARALDPDNALLSRGPSVRMSAEMLRDSALAASGLLVEKLGGPSVRPWQPEGLWSDAGQVGHYQPDSGANAHRRSLYTFRKRTVPVPNMSVFDAGTREACLPRRGATNTPLQALALLNDPVFVECARALAERATRDAPTRSARVERAFALACTRAPTSDEQDALLDLIATEVERFNGDLERARKLVGVPDAELAALALACSTIFASDGALVVR
ncbi:MAG: DUF1553 domain-containing protein [Planctomycetes bacterium]|nr:DUF1553 domain-containing protein [Planctomycetota bacterium]